MMPQQLYTKTRHIFPPTRNHITTRPPLLSLTIATTTATTTTKMSNPTATQPERRFLLTELVINLLEIAKDVPPTVEEGEERGCYMLKKQESGVFSVYKEGEEEGEQGEQEQDQVEECRGRSPEPAGPTVPAEAAEVVVKKSSPIAKMKRKMRNMWLSRKRE
ncbi:hypothetical protein M011DRAFT_74113 [Sporormia fimetaria CBS 119925]|uniref:Uncharacterized protein n=1 Tax=Sporormia fimetaria CBS 119925 TaxID=1340428 RepID=A0A6A6V7L2_9PLEO|nr:hypothetical protein M011DRAFT_74113 [Sporormia fimetaria CBS 119925]